MKKILYVDKNGEEKEIKYVLNLLKNSGVEYDHLTKNSDRENNEKIMDEFRSNYIPKIDNYNLLIEHTGPFDYVEILKKNPHLNILRISTVPEDLEFNKEDLIMLKDADINPERIQVAKYSSSKLNSYINKVKSDNHE